MIRMFLDGTEIVPDNSTSIKVIKENPYFTLSDSYTLEISVPLSVYGNRRFFGNIGRPEKAKKYKEYEARLEADNTEILKGQARITQSTNMEVKLQLTTGVSAMKMTAQNGNVYIDEMDLGELKPQALVNTRLDGGSCSDAVELMSPYSVDGYAIPLKDETNDLHSNICSSIFNVILNTTTCPYMSTCPNLLNIAEKIASRLGYKLEIRGLPKACHSIYIVTGIMSYRIAKKLPHWTVAEFFEELQNFFGCTIEDAGNRELRMVPLHTFSQRKVTNIDLLDEFEVDYTEDDDAKGIMNSNVEFSMSAADTEVVQDDILQSAKETLDFKDLGAATNDFLNNPDEKMRTIYDVGGLVYVGWKDKDTYSLRRIAPFQKLDRYKDASTVSLKIAPAHILENEECEIGYYPEGLMTEYRTIKFEVPLPGVENNFGIINREYTETADEEQKYTLQSLIEGDEELKKNDDKTDGIVVAFVDDNDYIVREVADTFKTPIKGEIRIAYTDFAYKVPKHEGKREKWSLSLNAIEGADFYLGQMHKLDFQCSRKCKMKGTFEADRIPDPKDIYIIRNKRYACEKIEANLKDGGIDRLMTGYFYELKNNDDK